jgi:ABC-type Fe3+ transport system substrate-binding protein
MRRTKGRYIKASALLSALVLLGGCSSSSGGGASSDNDSLSSASRDELIEQAAEEGELTLNWSEPGMGGSKAAALIEKGFREYYDLPSFEITYTPGPGMTQHAAALSQEIRAGQTATSDIFQSYAPAWSGLVNLGETVFEPSDWAWAENVPDEAIAPDGIAVEVQTSLPVITYNSDAVESPPDAMSDLLDPSWKGRVASTPFASNFHYWAGEIGEEKATDFLREFSENIGGLITCGESDRLLSGEFDALAFDCAQDEATINERSDGPLRYVIPSDAAMMSHIYVGVPVNAEHPAAARLWVNYVLSREVQDILWNLRGGDSIFVDGSHMEEVVSQKKDEGYTFSDWDLDRVLNSGEFPDAEYLADQVAILSGTE